MENKKQLVERLIKESKINIDEAMMLLGNEQPMQISPIWPYNGGWWGTVPPSPYGNDWNFPISDFVVISGSPFDSGVTSFTVSSSLGTISHSN